MSTLFTDSFPIISTAQGNQAAFDELEVLKTQYPNYDAYYVASGSVEDRRKPFEDLYQIYQPFADKHFLKEVKTV